MDCTTSRPAVPPKPDKIAPRGGDTSRPSSAVTIQPNATRKYSPSGTKIGHPSGTPVRGHRDESWRAQTSPNERSPQSLSPLPRVTSPISPDFNKSPRSPSKPALPPKPTGPVLLTPRQLLSVLPKPQSNQSKGMNSSNNSHNSNGHSTILTRINEPDVVHDFGNGTGLNIQVSMQSTHQRKQEQELLFTRSVRSPDNCVSARTEYFQSKGNQTRSQIRHTFVSPEKIGEAKKKSISLGRSSNLTLENFKATLGLTKASTMARVAPLDLSVSNRNFSSAKPIESMGKAITFAPNSSLPPPPPPRIRKKSSLSPQPQSPTSPTSVPATSFPLTSLAPADYAQVDKEKKWAMRRMKQGNSATQSLEISPVSEPPVMHLKGSNQIGSNRKPNVASVDIMSSQSRNERNANLKLDISNKTSSWLENFIPLSSECVNNDYNVTTPLYEEIHDRDFNMSSQDMENTAIISPEAKSVPVFINSEPKTQPAGNITSTRLSDNDSFLFAHLNKGAMQTQNSVTDSNTFSLSDSQGVYASGDTLTHLKENDATTTQTVVEEQSRKDTVDGFTQNNKSDKLLHMGDLKIQSAMSVSSSPLEGTEKDNEDPAFDIVPKALSVDADQSFEYHVHPTPKEAVDTQCPEDNKETSQVANLVSQIVLSQFAKDSPASNKANEESEDRRSSWSPSLSESSMSSGLDGTNRGSFSRSWLDDDEISTGAYADADSSDTPVRTSTEDIQPPGGHISNRKRLTNLFASLGKGGSSSSSSSKQKDRRKQKVQSQFFLKANGSDVKGTSGKVPKGIVRHVSDVMFSTVVPEALSPSSNFNEPPKHRSSAPSIDSTNISISKPTVQFRDPVVQAQSENASVDDDNRLSMTFSEEGGPGDESESVTSSSSSSVSYEEIIIGLSQQERKVFYVAKEIMTSERTFVDVLNLLTVDFRNAIKQAEELHGHPIIVDSDLEQILGGLPENKTVNEELLRDLEDRIHGWKANPKVSDIFLKKGQFLKLYSTYIRDFEKNSVLLDSCVQGNPLLASAVRNFECSSRCQKLNLKHYLLKPVQRMPQYGLLLEDYLKQLPEDNEDYADTVKAIAIVREVAEHANDAIKLQVNAEKLLHLQNRLTVPIVLMTGDRLLIKDGELMKVCRKDLQPRFFALMTDCLFCCTYNAASGSTRDLKLRYELPLAGMRVCLSSTDDYQFEFSVISVTRSFNLIAKSTKERDDWMKQLNDAIANNIKKRAGSAVEVDQDFEFQLGKVAPLWVQDSRVTMCQLCTAEFTMTFRRHHCRACGKVFCGNCSGSFAPLEYQKFEASTRVCDECFQILQEEFDEKNCEIQTPEVEAIRSKFKKMTMHVSKRAHKVKRTVPQRLEVQANNAGAKISGYLQWREKEKKNWKRHWFVLMDRVLYIYAASEDIVALRSIPILGWSVAECTEQLVDGVDGQLIFKLTHSGQLPLVFQAETISAVEKWIDAMKEAIVFI